jgi:hypothetical protein
MVFCPECFVRVFVDLQGGRGDPVTRATKRLKKLHKENCSKPTSEYRAGVDPGLLPKKKVGPL